MAQTILLPRAPDTGFAQLGQALYSGINDAADRRLRQNEIARLREQRLADIADERQYEQGRVADTRQYEQQIHGRGRTEMLADEQRRIDNEFKSLLLKDGYLPRDKFDDPAAVQAAYAQAARDGRTERYKDLINAGMLDAGDLNNPKIVEAARTAIGSRNEYERVKNEAIADTARSRGGDMANRLVLEEDGVRGQMENLANSMATPPAAPSRTEILNLARQLWMADHPGKVAPTKEADLSAEIAQAQDTLEKQLIQNWQIKQMSGREIFKNLKERLDSIDATKRGLINLRIFADPSAAGSTMPSRPAAAPALPPVDVDAARARARAAAVGAPAPQSAPQGGIPGTYGAQPSPVTQPVASGPAPRAQPTQATPGAPSPFQYSGGLMGLMERSGALLSAPGMDSALSGAGPSSPIQASRFIDRASEIPTRLDRAAGAIGTGLLTGDYSVPSRGGLESIGQNFGDFNDQIAQQADEDVLKNAPYSLRAFEIRRERGLPDPQPAMR